MCWFPGGEFSLFFSFSLPPFFLFVIIHLLFESLLVVAVVNMLYPPQKSVFSAVGQDGTQLHGDSMALLEASSTRYIQQLELEVAELTQQYDTACQLLYHAVLVQDASAIVMDECEARGLIVKDESAAHSDLLRLFFRVTTMRRQVESVMMPRGSEKATAPPPQQQQQNESAMTSGKIPDCVVNALQGSLREENERLTRLLEAIPQRVCSALTVKDAAGVLPVTSPSTSNDLAQADAVRNGSTDLKQYLESILTRIEEVVKNFRQTGTPEAEPTRTENLVGIHVASLQNIVRSLEKLSIRIEEVLDQYENDVKSNSSPRPNQMPKAEEPCVSQAETSFLDSKVPQDMLLLQRLAYNSVATLESLFSEYMLAFERMQMMAENEMHVFSSVQDRWNMLRWNACMEEKACEIRRLQCEVERLENQAVARDAKDAAAANTNTATITNATQATKAPSTLAQLYAQFAAPFIPPNVRIPRAAKMQSIVTLRTEAMRLGARPASAFSAAGGEAALVAPQSSAVVVHGADAAFKGQNPSETVGVAVRKKGIGVRPPEEPARDASVESAGRNATQQEEANQKKGEENVAPQKLDRYASVSPRSASTISSGAVPEDVAVMTDDGAARPSAVASEKRESGTMGIVIRRLQRDGSMSSSTTSGNDDTISSLHDEGGEAHDDTHEASKPAVVENSFDESSDTPPKTRQSELVKSFSGANLKKDNRSEGVDGPFFAVSLEGKEKESASRSQRPINRNVESSSLSSTSITLTLDISECSGKKRQRAAKKRNERPCDKSLSSDWDDTPPRDVVREKKKGGVKSNSPSIRAKTVVSGLKALSFTSHR
ncbi:hypothetical protein MOQ_000379 [Trypanosoma cruzi marinkellei]|uniref:Uncharacterized protein n=1 Tax=Trypanosoma cruzi marinkellei TaxID=85056 RepID=K2NJ18_TRYCR|nr:hypothetical protein MOQ_000379 [Trypanosoma cruzi marinkellei]